MFLKKINKKNKNSQKEYTYYRLVHSYKIGSKIRHQTIMSLGSLSGVSKQDHKALADRIEELITGNNNLLFSDNQRYKNIEDIAQKFADKIIKDKLFTANNNKSKIEREIKNNYQEVDLETIEQIQSKEIGGEWLVKQAFEKLGIDEILSNIGLTANQIKIAQLLLSAKLLHPSSELETERWLSENSAAQELYQLDENISRYKLYKLADIMYNNKELIDRTLYSNITDLFSGKNKIVIFDLTNMYFTGQMQGSEKAEFGRSKQKQTGSRLIGLALSIDSTGNVRYSKFYKGNISEPGTFATMIKDVSSQFSSDNQVPVVVMDAGIATEENLALLRSDKYKYDYVCVSRTIPKEYEKLTENAQSITDNRGNKIELTKINVEGKPDNFLHIKSEKKELKEKSIDEKLTKRLELQLQDIKDKLDKPRAVKKIEKVHEKVGKIKAKLSKIGWLYDIKYTEDKKKGVITDITWKRIKERERPKGEYFLRYTKTAVSENDIWDVYNLTRDVESVFRTLKTDLDIRPIYHQKDAYTEPHIWLGILAYQVVNYIRRALKDNNINYSWQSITEKMKTMQSSIVSINNKENEKIYIKLCTRPTTDQKKIFDALNFKHRPFIRKTKLVPQL
jgi:hypothetical protein